MSRWLRDNSLSLTFLLLFLGAVAGQSIAGQHVYNDEATMHGQETISYARYLVSSHFGQALLENWQSVPPVRALRLPHDLPRPARVERVEEARGRRA